MKPFPPPRFESAPAMLLAGLRRHHSMSDAATSVPEHWAEFRKTGLRGAPGEPVYGAICSAGGDRFEYMTGVEVAAFDGLADHVGRMRVPAQTYAVFAHGGPVSDLGALWQHIWREWLPDSGYEDGETPPFERFGAGFDPDTGEGGFEIWFPIRTKRG